MSQQDQDPSSRRDPSSPATTFPPLPPSSPGLALPPISSIYNFVSADTASAPDRIPHPPSISSSSSWPPAPPHDHRGDADHASSLGLWATTTTPADADADGDGDGDDYDDDTNFVYEHGRRYHANADGRVLYPLPNDESEQERDDMKHKLALWMMHGRLFYAPVEDVMERGGVVFDLGERSPPPPSFFIFSSLFSLDFTGTYSLLSVSACILPTCRQTRKKPIIRRS